MKLILSLFFAVFTASYSTRAQLYLPDNFPALPVLIHTHPLVNDSTGSKSGTGIYIADSGYDYLVTAAHVVFNMNNKTNRYELNNQFGEFYSYSNDGTNRSVLHIDFSKLLSGGRIKRHESHDVAVILIEKVDATTNPTLFNVEMANGVSSDKTFHELSSMWGSTACEPFDNIAAGDDVFIVGYPLELFNNGMAAEINPFYPLVRKGIVSQKNQNNRKLILDTTAYGGNSGGPVWVIKRTPLGDAYHLGGIVTQFVPYSTRLDVGGGFTNSVLVNSGYTVVEPMDYALELIKQFKIQ